MTDPDISDAPAPERSDLHYRVWQEFQEMPGLRLTLGQACRLWHHDPATVVSTLNDLIDAAILRRIGPYFVRADLSRFTA